MFFSTSHIYPLVGNDLIIFRLHACVYPNSVYYNKLVAEERILKFFEDLNFEYVQFEAMYLARGRVLGMDPLPSLQETFAYVQYEESLNFLLTPTEG